MNATFLIADDDMSLQTWMKWAIKKYASLNGVKIIQVDNLADTKMMASCAAVILLDLKLKDATKEQTVQAIPELAKVAPVIVLTGYEDNNIEESELLNSVCRDYGAHFAFFKTMMSTETMPWIMLAVQAAMGHWMYTHKKN